MVEYLKQFSNIYEIGNNIPTKSQLKKIINQNETLYYDANGEG